MKREELCAYPQLMK